MKINNTVRLILVAISSVQLLAMCTPTACGQDAEESYARGLEAYKAQKWGEAAKNILKSYEAMPSPQKACILSSAYMMAEKPKLALNFANKSLAATATPPLNGDYKKKAKEIADWAKKAVKDEYYLEAKVDDPAAPKVRPPSPKAKPPKPLKP